MKIAGNYTIDAPRDRVWEALNDIDVLARVVPGCQKLEMTGENEFEGTVKIGIQSIKGTYNGRIRLTEVQPPHHYTLVANGKGSNGIVDGTGTVDLEEQDGKTLLKYGGDAKVSGTIASVGQRLIEGAAKQLINQSLKALVEQIKQREAGVGAATNGASDGPASEAAATASAPESAPVQPPQPSEIKSELDRRAVAMGGAPATSVPEVQSAPVASESSPTIKSELDRRAVAVGGAPATSVPHVEDTGDGTTRVVGGANAMAQPPSFERRTVVVPEDEQLKPESVAFGMVQDFVGERPWLPWVAVAFLLGILFGRRGN